MQSQHCKRSTKFLSLVIGEKQQNCAGTTGIGDKARTIFWSSSKVWGSLGQRLEEIFKSLWQPASGWQCAEASMGRWTLSESVSRVREGNHRAQDPLATRAQP